MMTITTALHLNHLINKAIERAPEYRRAYSQQIVTFNDGYYLVKLTMQPAGSMNRYDVKVEIDESTVLNYSHLHIGKSWSANIGLIEAIEQALNLRYQ